MVIGWGMLAPILVTGGAGYIGSHVVRRLLERHESVVVLDSLAFGHQASIPSDRVQFLKGNLFESDLLDRMFYHYKFDAVMHLAASTLVGESMKDPVEYYRNNVGGALSLLTAMRDHGCLKMVLASTCAIYGNPVSTPISEDHPRNPVSPYGSSKLMVEQILQDCSTSWGLRYVALRFFNACGSHPDGDIGEDHRPETHLIPVVLQTALGLRPSVTIFGTDHPTEDGTCVRDYVHVCDIADAHSMALDYLRHGNQSVGVNLGTGRGHSVKEVISTARDVTGCEIPALYAGPNHFDPPALVADPSMAESVLGWKAKTPKLRHCIEDAWRWMSGPRRGRY